MKVEDERRYVEYVTSRLPWIRKVAFLLCQDWHRAAEIRHLVHGTVDLRERGAIIEDAHAGRNARTRRV